MAKEKQETKLCKHCKTEIPYNAKVCPNCRKKQGGKLKWIIIAVVVLGIIGAVGGGGGEDEKEPVGQQNVSKDNEDTKKQTTSKQDTTDDKKQQDTKEEQDNNDKKEDNNVLKVGSSFEKGGLKITVDDADLKFTDYEDEYNMYSPKDGNKYVMVAFTFENSGKTDAYVSIYDFNCYADNTACDQAYLPDESDFVNTNLSPNRNISFKTYYEVPKKAKSIELEYETSFWTNEKAIIKLK